MNTAICAILKGCSLVKTMCVVVHEKRIMALFLSTLFTIIQHRFSYNTGKQLFCAPDFFRMRIIFLIDKGSNTIFRCRSPPSDFDFAS